MSSDEDSYELDIGKLDDDRSQSVKNPECAFADISEPTEPQPMTEQETMALLPPDHPLLATFQTNLRKYLLWARDRLREEVNETKYRIKLKEQEREEEGVKLYDRQQEMTYQNELLEELHKKIEEHSEKRHQEEAAVKALKQEFDGKVGRIKESKTIYNKRMMELEQLNTLENNIRQWAYELDDEVKNAKRTVNRDTQIQQQISEEKKKSDMLFYHLDVEIKKNESDLKIINDEIANMTETICVLNQSLSCANTDLEVLQTEHKRLNLAWSEVIVAISHRDKLLFQLNTELEKQREGIRLCTFSIEAIRKQIHKEMEKNQKLKTFKLRLQNDFGALKRECQKQSKILSELEIKLEEIPMWLAQTEKDMTEARREGTNIQNEIRRLQIKVDKNNAKKFEIEENILKSAQDQIVTDKAAEYRHKLLNQARDLRRQLDMQLAKTQNQLSELLLQLEQEKNVGFRLRQENEELQQKMDAANKKSDELMAELKALEDNIDLKLKRIDKLNNDLDVIRKRRDDITTSPIEVKIGMLEKTIQAAEQQIREHQRFWLMLQNHYVNLTQKRNAQINEIQVTHKQLAIIKQKSLKIDNDLESSEEKTRAIMREINVYTSKIELLNSKMSKRQQEHEEEEHSCELEHSEMIDRLKQKEMEVLKVEEEINETQIEIDRLKDLVLDKHREVLSWETKYKLIEETLRWRKDDSSNSELNTMRTEIHRMQIRHNQLKRAQEKLVTDLEHCVIHREHIFMTATNRQRIETNPARPKLNASVQQKILDLRTKLRQVQEEISFITEKRMVQNARDYECAQKEIRALSERIDRETEQYELLRTEIEESILLKYVNLENIVRKQNRAKAYHQLRKTLPAPKFRRSETSINSMMQKQLDINHNLMEILQNLTVDYPDQKIFFSKVLQLLKD